MGINIETILVLGVFLSGLTFIMLLVLSMLIDRNARKTVKDLKAQIAEVNSNLMVAINALVAIGKVVIPVKKEEAVQQVQPKEEAPAKPAKKAVYPKGSPEAKARMAALREAAAKKKADQEAAAKEENKEAKLKEIAELEAKLNGLKGGQQ